MRKYAPYSGIIPLQIVPIDAAGRRSAEIAPNATLKIYEGAPHGLPITLQDRLNADLLEFIRG
jgi:non-heme chloroperoxidase